MVVTGFFAQCTCIRTTLLLVWTVKLNKTDSQMLISLVVIPLDQLKPSNAHDTLQLVTAVSCITDAQDYNVKLE